MGKMDLWWVRVSIGFMLILFCFRVENEVVLGFIRRVIYGRDIIF